MYYLHVLGHNSVIGSALELGRYNITVNAYAPGIIETPMCMCQHDAVTVDYGLKSE